MASAGSSTLDWLGLGWTRSLAAGAIGVLTVAGLAPGAAADDILVIPIGGIVRGAEGDVVGIGSVSVPSDLVGETCDVRGQTVNQISVHDGNDLLITTAGQTFVIPNFEDAGFITHEAGVTESLGSTISLQVRLGPDGLSSGGFRVSIDCQPPAPTTETTEAPDTTEPATTQPSSESTDVQPSAPDTSVPPVSTPDSTEPESTVPGDTVPGDTVPPAGPTTEAPAPTTTAAPTTEPPPAGPSADDEVSAGLPVTGSNSGLWLAAGAALIGVGVATRRLARAGSEDPTGN